MYMWVVFSFAGSNSVAETCLHIHPGTLGIDFIAQISRIQQRSIFEMASQAAKL